jgi:anthranilate phosphoribosyltransferase
MIRETISKLSDGYDLTRDEARQAMNEIMSGEATDAQIAAFLTALRMKGETIEEITGCAQVMREKVTTIKTIHPKYVDTCGTGGDRKGTFNVSTCASFLVAAAGIPVAKHGNRSVSSSCGSADVLAELGVKIDAPLSVSEKCLNEIGICFLFAPLFHKAMKYAMPTRQQIGIRTVFNIIGPLTNPAMAPCQVLGVFNESLTDTLAQVLRNLNTHHALVCFGIDGLDEITISGDTKIVELKNGKIMDYYVEPGDFGFSQAPLESILGGNAKINAEIIKSVLDGKKGPQREIVLMNAGAAILAGDGAQTLKEGIEKAAMVLDSGLAMQKLHQLIEMSNSTEGQ